jgi:hypothetical protein
MEGKIKATIHEELKQVNYVGMTADAWTSPNGDKFFGVTVSYLDKSWKVQELLLSVNFLDPKHEEEMRSSRLLAEIINDTIDSFQIREKIIGVTTDAGSDVVAACNLAGVFSVWCLNHLISLCICDMFEKSKLKSLFKKLKEISKHFTRSNKSTHLLQNFKGEELFQFEDNSQHTTIKTHCKTRWLSSFPMVDSIIRNLRAVMHVINKHEFKNTEVNFSQMKLDEDDWTSIYQLWCFLEQFQDVMLMFERKDTSSFSEIHPTVAYLISTIEQSVEKCNNVDQEKSDENDQVDSTDISFIDCSQVFEQVDVDMSLLHTRFTDISEAQRFIKKEKERYDSIEENLLQCNETMRDGLNVLVAGIKKRYANKYEHRYY